MANACRFTVVIVVAARQWDVFKLVFLMLTHCEKLVLLQLNYKEGAVTAWRMEENYTFSKSCLLALLVVAGVNMNWSVLALDCGKQSISYKLLPDCSANLVLKTKGC